jgi:hypothetical protein
MPFLMYVDSRPDPPGGERRPWEPNWRVWRWVAAAAFVAFAADHATGAIQYLLVVAVVALVCQALSAALPSMGGLREWRQ